jgi:hypothetical protein
MVSSFSVGASIPLSFGKHLGCRANGCNGSRAQYNNSPCTPAVRNSAKPMFEQSLLIGGEPEAVGRW